MFRKYFWNVDFSKNFQFSSFSQDFLRFFWMGWLPKNPKFLGDPFPLDPNLYLLFHCDFTWHYLTFLCFQKSSKNNVQKVNPVRDSNPQPLDSKSNALSIAPTGPDLIFIRKETKQWVWALYKKEFPGRELNPGLPRDRRKYWPLYYRGYNLHSDLFSRIKMVQNEHRNDENARKFVNKKWIAVGRTWTCAGRAQWISSPPP